MVTLSRNTAMHQQYHDQKASRKAATDSTPRGQAKRPRLSLDAFVVEAGDKVSHSGTKEKYIGNNFDNLLQAIWRFCPSPT